MPAGKIYRELKEGYGPSRESLFDSLRLDNQFVHIQLIPSDTPPVQLSKGCELYAHQQVRFRCCVESIAKTHRYDDVAWFVVLADCNEVMGKELGRVIMSFSYSSRERSAPESVTVEWTTETCTNRKGGGCGTLLWPGESGVCRDYPDCCSI